MIDDVHVGEGGWLFLKGGSNEVLRYYTEPDFFDDEMVAQWINILADRTKFFRDRNIKYVHTIAPEKLSVFPEGFGKILPYLDCTPIKKLTKAILDGKNTVCFLDVSSTLIAKDGNFDTYFKTDTHWNLRGAYNAYKAICTHLGYKIEDNFENRRFGSWPVVFDLGQKLDPPVSEDHLWIPFQANVERKFANEIVLLQESAAATGKSPPMHHGSHVIFRNELAQYKETVVIFGDSFSDFRPGTFTSLFTEIFSEVHFFWSHNIDRQYCLKVNASVVISEIAERFMRQCPNDQIDVSEYVEERLRSYESRHAGPSLPTIVISEPKPAGFEIKSRVRMNDSTVRSMAYAQGFRRRRPQPIPVYPGQEMRPLIRGMDRNKANPDFDFKNFPDVLLNIHEIKDAYFIIENGMDNVICTADRDLILESTWFMARETNPDGSLFLKTEVSNVEFDDVFLGFDSAWHNYYHFLLLGISRSFLAWPLVGKNCKIIVPDYVSRREYSQLSYSENSFNQALHFSGLENKVLKLPVGIYKAKRIRFFWPDNLDPTLLAYMDIFDHVFRHMRQRIPKAEALPKRIFLSRERGTNPRMTADEISIFNDFIEHHDFTKVFFEEHDLIKQAQLLMNADSIMAPHGAGLGNIMFGRPDLRVNELNRDIDGQGFLRSCFFQAASLNGQPYAFLNQTAGDFTPEIIERFFEISARAS